MSNCRKRLTITITGETTEGLGYSLQHVKRLAEDGYLSGHDNNETDDYEFSVIDDLTQPVMTAENDDV